MQQEIALIYFLVESIAHELYTQLFPSPLAALSPHSR